MAVSNNGNKISYYERLVGNNSNKSIPTIQFQNVPQSASVNRYKPQQMNSNAPVYQKSARDQEIAKLSELALTGSQGQKTWAWQQAISKGYVLNAPLMVGSNVKLGNDYSKMPDTNLLKQYAKQQAQNNFNNQDVGLRNKIGYYESLLGGLQTDKAIGTDVYNRIASVYDREFANLDRLENRSRLDAQRNAEKAQKLFEKNLSDLLQNSHVARERQKELVSSRGLWNSSILDNTLNAIDTETIGAEGDLRENLQTQINDIENQLTALVEQYNAQRNNMSLAERREMENEINRLITERNAKRDEYLGQITMINNERSANYGAIENNATNMYNDLFSEYQNKYNAQQEALRREALERERLEISKRAQNLDEQKYKDERSDLSKQKQKEDEWKSLIDDLNRIKGSGTNTVKPASVRDKNGLVNLNFLNDLESARQQQVIDQVFGKMTPQQQAQLNRLIGDVSGTLDPSVRRFRLYQLALQESNKKQSKISNLSDFDPKTKYLKQNIFGNLYR